MIINEDLIIFDLDAKSKEEVIYKLAESGLNSGKVVSMDMYVSSVLEREKTYTTGVGNGIAIPHAKTDSVKEAMIVFAKLCKAVEWGSLDDKPVDMVFLLGVPDEGADNLHLKLLSQLSRKLVNNEFIDLLRKAETKQEVLSALSDIKVS